MAEIENVYNDQYTNLNKDPVRDLKDLIGQ